MRAAALRKSVFAGGMCLVLSGCGAVPAGVEVASWAVDGISYIFTGKSVTDHGISVAADQDCSVMRVFSEGKVCREQPRKETEIAEDSPGVTPAARTLDARRLSAQAQPDRRLPAGARAFAPATQDLQRPDQRTPGRLGEFNTAAGGPATNDATRWSRGSAQREREAHLRAAGIPARRAPEVRRNSGTPPPGNYFLLGSFPTVGDARSLVQKRADLKPRILSGSKRGVPVYRVVVGPFDEKTTDLLAKRVFSKGGKLPWIVRIDARGRAFARPVQPKPEARGPLQFRATVN